MPDERISVDQALSAYTYGTAFQAGDETHRGRLSVGFDADLVLLDRNIRELEPKEIHKAQILGTWILGKRIFTNETSR
jgi:predicted amidohydrolase YtcJ